MICVLNRLRISGRVTARRDLTANLKRHVDLCPGCRRHYEEERAVDRSLSLLIAGRQEPASPFLRGRIMAGIRREGHAGSGERTAHGVVRWIVASAGGAAALAVLFAVWQWRPATPTAPPPLVVASTWDSLLPRSADLARIGTLLDQPLLVEGQLVLRDAQDAVEGLVNILPAGFSLAGLW